MKLSNLLSGYETISEGKTHAGKKTVKKRFVTRKLSGNISHARSISDTRDLFTVTSYTSSRAYGALLLTFAVLTMLLSSGIDFLIIKFPANRTSFITGAVAAAVSVPFFMLEGPIVTAIERHKILSDIVFDFFCIKRPVKGGAQHGIPVIVCVAVGILLAVIGFFTSSFAVAAVMACAVYAYLAFVSPEFSLFACMLILPSVSMLGIHNYLACFLAASMLLSYLRKVAVGKRNYNFEQYDLLIILMMLFVLLSGIFAGGPSSFEFALVIIGSTSVYFATGNIITNPRLLGCMTRAFIYSSVLPSVTALVQFIVLWTRSDFIAALDAGVDGTFISGDSLACFLIVPLCFSFVYAGEKRSAACVLIGVLDCLAIFVCGNFFAPVAILIAAVIHAFIKTKKLAVIPILAFLTLPYMLMLLPDLTGASFIIGDELADTLEIWKASLELIRENIMLGVGLGSEEFAVTIGELCKIPSIDARNVFIDMAVKAGVPTALFFGALLVVRLFHRISYNRYLKESSVGPFSSVASLAVIAFIVFGTFNQMFTDISLYYVFFSLFAMGSATLRIACAEHDDRVAYFKDASQSHAAAVDVDLHTFMQH